jgi:hypothetical protein
MINKKTTTIGELKAWVNSLGEDQNDKLFAYRLANEDTDGSITVFDFAINATIMIEEDNTYLAVDDKTMEHYNNLPTPESETPNEQ